MDIGTDSVGYAVTLDGCQKIMKKGKKALWGVRLFDEAKTAADRRGFRSTRRRYGRRRYRIKLLQDEFREEVNKVDPNFFDKLAQSKYNVKDTINKTIKISSEEAKQVKDYYRKYKTIYHLRKKLIENPEKEDIRLVYLAIHHIIKYRGNFLNPNSSFNAEELDVESELINVFDSLCLEPSINFSEDYKEIIDIKKIVSIIISNDSKNDIKVGLNNELSSVADKNFINEFYKMIVGNQFTFNKMLTEQFDEEVKISFSKDDYEKKCVELEDKIGDKIELLSSFKSLYEIVLLKKIFITCDTPYISFLMVNMYNQHEKDLDLLKKMFKNNKNLYNKIFVNEKDKRCLYNSYIKNEISNQEFVNRLEKLFDELFVSNTNIDQKYIDVFYKDANVRMGNGSFMPRITSIDNSIYPYQLNKSELEKIIKNQGKYYPFLLNKTNDSVYKIVKLLEFRIPYYVGPLVSKDKSEFAWMVRKEMDAKITPYNFDEVVDKEESAENFIKRMISHCTYLLNEPVLPNNSILYSQYKVLNELKQIRINGYKLTTEQIKDILNNLFEKNSGTITEKKFIDYLLTTNDYDMYGSLNITGYSAKDKFANNMQSYYDFFSENGIFANTNYTIDDAELIIEWVTLFEDKDILKIKLNREFPNLDNFQIQRIVNLNYKGWGSLSKKLLTTKYYKDKETGNYKSIMDLMYETKENFMQMINNNKYNFQKMIDSENNYENFDKVEYKLVENLVTSPATKKGIYQALKVVSELINYIGYEPKNIMIEMARHEGKKVRTTDRKEKILEIYKNSDDKIDDYENLVKELKDRNIDSKDEKLYLYFIQEGKCLYSGKSLNIDDLSSYEVDHILPRSLVKDDSIDNKALVCKECNQLKGANLVLPNEYRTHQNIEWWKRLNEIGLISTTKFNRLKRKEYSDEDISGFINRQLVETRQICKHVGNILGNLYKKTNIVYLKANFISNYRNMRELFKFRDLNDYHHAHDAYLAAVLGEYKEKFMNINVSYDMVKEFNSIIKEVGLSDKLIYGYVINSLDNDGSIYVNKVFNNLIDKETGEVLFNAEEFNKTVEETLYRNDILISRKTEIRSGMFYNETIRNKLEGKYPIKENMPVELYGGYDSLKSSYLCLVKYNNELNLINIPVSIALKSKENNDAKINYIRNSLNLETTDNFDIVIDNIPFESEIIYKNQNVYIKGYSSGCELSNAKQLKIKKEKMVKWKRAFNYILNNKENYEKDAIKYIDEIIDYLLSLDKEYPLFESSITYIKDNIKLDDLVFIDKKNLVIQLLILYKCNSVNANLSFLNLSSRIGRMSKKNILNDENTKIIYKSVTGIKESEKFLRNE